MKIKIIVIALGLIAAYAIAEHGFNKDDDAMRNKKKYSNTQATETMVNFRFQTLKDFMFKKGKVPKAKFKFPDFDRSYFQNLNKSPLSVAWFGHSSGLLEIEGKLILFDPVFSDRLGPVKGFGTKRFHKSVPIKSEDIPAPDIVLISHDHYDHLDKTAIKELKDKAGKFIVPEGVTNDNEVQYFKRTSGKQKWDFVKENDADSSVVRTVKITVENGNPISTAPKPT